MKLLITGATGFLGRNLLEVLANLSEPLELICLVRDMEKAQALTTLPKPVTLLHGDLLNPETLTALPSDLDLVFHVAALVGLKNGPVFYDINVTGTRNLLHALFGQQQLKRILQISSIAAIDRPPGAKPPYAPLTEADAPYPHTDYGKSKLEAEKLVIESGLPFTILRPSYIFGPYPRPGSTMDRVIYDVQSGNPYTRFPFSGHASEIYAQDLAEMMWHAAREPQCLNEIYFAANPEPVSVRHFFKTLYTLLNKPYHPYPVPRLLLPWLKRAMLKEGLAPEVGEILFHDYFLCDPGKLYRHLSYRPYYGFEAGLTRTVQWYRHQGLLH
jgi:nucleoside-diphosphate-sugar epimerase